jgi:hypothetical protein
MMTHETYQVISVAENQNMVTIDHKTVYTIAINTVCTLNIYNVMNYCL